MALVFFGLPVAIYLSLCLLPRGRPAAIGIGVAAGAALVFTLTAPPGEEGEFRAILGVIAGIAIALAGIAQTIRAALGPGRPAWLWPAIVAVALAVALAVLLFLLGV